MFFRKAKKETAAKTLQHVAFPVEAFESLSKAEKNRFYQEIRDGGWEYAIRAYGWLVESRYTSAALPADGVEGIFGIEGARVMTEREVEELREMVRISNESLVLDRMTADEEMLIKPFDEFATKANLARGPYVRALNVLRHFAAQGKEVKEQDLQANDFAKAGNLKVLFGDRLDEVLDFQNGQARAMASAQ